MIRISLDEWERNSAGADNGYSAGGATQPDTLYMHMMPVPRCDGCKHWRPENFSNNGRNSQLEGECMYALGGGDVKLMAWCEDPVIVTQADFGCVEWEAK